MAALLLDLEAALPAGADRLLIEAQSGTAAHATPFAGALAMTVTGPRPIARPQSPPPLATPLARAHPARPNATLPILPRRSRAGWFAAIGAIAALLIAGGAWARFGRTHGAGERSDPAQDLSAQLTQAPAAVAPSAAPAQVAAAAPPAEAHEPPPAAQAPVDDEQAPAAAEPPTAAAPVVTPVTAHPAPGRPGVKKLPLRPVVTRRGARPHLVAEADPPGAMAPAAASAEPAAPAVDSAPAPAPEPERVAEPPPPPASPLPAPPAAGPPPVAAAPAAATAPAAPRSLDAVPEITSFDLQGSLASSVARRSVERALPGLRACYAAAARAGRAAPAIELRLSFEIDENSLATHVATGDPRFGGFGRCAAGVAGQIRTTQAPDVGTARVVAVIQFHPL
jgi:hypothetical protein